MHSFTGRKLLVIGSLVGSIRCAAIAPPVITPAPELDDVLVQRQIPDPISFAQLLLTAIPQSLREIAATNAPAVSSILWEEFLDDNRPQWFLDLPYEVQSYLIRQFGPSTAWLPPRPTTSGAQATPTESFWSWPTNTGSSQPSRSTARSSVRSSIASRSSGFSTQSRSASFSAAVSSSAASAKSSSVTSANSAASANASDEPQSPPASNAGLTKQQKVGLGVGIPFGILGAAAVLLACCFLLRRRRNRKHNGTERPSSPGFIPRFAFQDKSTDNFEHRKPLNPRVSHASQNLGASDWDEDGVDPFEYDSRNNTAYRGHTLPPAGPVAPAPAATNSSAPMAMHDATPIMAPVVFHTHSSNRARGKRTSYSSLHSVAEVSEPDENIESPVLGRHATTPLERKRRPSMPMVLEIPATPTATSKSAIKRKPVPSSPIASNSAADLASESLLRPTMPSNEHSGSSSSGLALSTHSSTYANPPTADHASPVSPISSHPSWGSSNVNLPRSTNPFSNDYSYVEDYGPEYHPGYVDVNDGLYGGHKSLSRYPDPSPTSQQRRGSGGKTEWPLRNMNMGRKRRDSSPLWDRVYESP